MKIEKQCFVLLVMTVFKGLLKLRKGCLSRDFDMYVIRKCSYMHLCNFRYVFFSEKLGTAFTFVRNDVLGNIEVNTVFI